MVRGDQTGHEGGVEEPSTGNKKFDRKYKKHGEAIKDFSVREKSGINDGVIYDRSCTDFFFMILFVLSFLGIFGVAIYALTTGDPSKLTAPYDADGALCGYPGVEGSLHADVSKLPYLYFTKMPAADADLKADDVKELLKTGVCVAKCPGEAELGAEFKDAKTWLETEANCADALPDREADQDGKNGPITCATAKPYYSKSYFGLKLCMPDAESMKSILEQIKDTFLESEGGQALQDMAKTWKTTLTLIFTGLLVSFLFMWLMSKCARCLALTAVALLLLSFFGGGAACLYLGTQKHTIEVDGVDQETMNTALLVTGAVLMVFGLCTACCIWCNRTSLETAIAIIDASADFMIDTKRLILVSVYYFFLSMIFFFLWIFSVACTFSLVPFDPPKDSDETGQIKQFQSPDGKIWGMFGFLLFGFLWIFTFLGHQSNYITMVSAATYYFDSNESKDGSASVCTGFSFAYVKNVGSIALGSLILTIIKILRFIVETLAEADGEGDGVKKLIACIAKCCMACLESLVEHLTNTAYAYMAVSGDSFCESAWNGFIINLKHLAKFVFALQIASLFVFMGIIAITCVNTGIGFLLAKHAIGDSAGVTNIVPSLIVFAIVSFIVAIVFLGSFEDAVRATLICFAVDSDLHDGKPKFGPKSYHDKLAKIYDYGDQRVYDDLQQPLTGGGAGGANAMHEGGEQI